MPVESAADRAVFFNPDEFGVTARYVPFGGASSDVSGNFDYATREDFGLGSDSPGMETGAPRFQCRFADLPAAANEADGDLLIVRGAFVDKLGERVFTADDVGADEAAFKVRSIRPDGTGLAYLSLALIEEL